MKRAVAYLEPFMEAEEARQRARPGKIVLATVKGDVHDIGKNIVGVVLACNGYEVIDLGVMVHARHDPQHRRRAGLRRRRAVGADHALARRDGVGGDRDAAPRARAAAADRRRHHLAAAHGGADRARLRAGDGARARRLARRRRRQRAARRRPPRRRSTPRTAPSRSGCARPRREAAQAPAARSRGARDTGRRSTGAPSDLAVAAFTGTREVAPAIAELRGYIDWSFFFHAWELKGRFPAILDDPRQGAAARDLYARGERAARRRSWPAACCERTGRLRLLAGGRRGRRHRRSPTARASRCCASRPTSATRAPTARSPTTSRPPEPGSRTTSARSPSAIHGPRSSRARTRPTTTTTARSWSRRSPTGWRRRSRSTSTCRCAAPGTRPTSSSTHDDLARERYRGIRPAFGYPACPDHSEKRRLFDAARRRAVGLTLTESCAMRPAAAVSGIYFAHPQARYFSIGRIGQDQLEEYATAQGHDARRGGTMAAPEPLDPPAVREAPHG